MTRNCPEKKCLSHCTGRDGRYFRASDSKWIQRFVCFKCGKKFSSATFDPAYRQHKRRVNTPLERLLSSGVSMRRSAIILNINYKTVERKLRFLGQLARRELRQYWEQQEGVESFHFDDLITIEHTKCKPLSVTVAVETKKRKLLGFSVSSTPATGHLAKISRRKYGYRKDKRARGIAKLFKSIQPWIQKDVMIFSDEHLLYPSKVVEFFPQASYKRFKGARSCITGQGELKRLVHDPLFPINHTLAMMRANINRLFRRTWCTTKKPERLEDHLYIYGCFHNRTLTAI